MDARQVREKILWLVCGTFPGRYFWGSAREQQRRVSGGDGARQMGRAVWWSLERSVVMSSVPLYGFILS